MYFQRFERVLLLFESYRYTRIYIFVRYNITCSLISLIKSVVYFMFKIFYV